MRDIIYSKIKEGLYAIEEDGRVYSNFTKKYMKTSIDKDGYPTISLKNDRNGYSHFGIHRLLMIAYNPVDNMENLQVNHKDGNKLNNKLENLEWCTCEENKQTRLNQIFDKKGQQHINHKISEQEAKKIIKLYKQGVYPRDILKEVPNASKNIINSIIHNKTWKHLQR